jgi:hypothetical protein
MGNTSIRPRRRTARATNTDPDETEGRKLYRALADKEAALSLVPLRRVRLGPEPSSCQAVPPARSEPLQG